MKTTRRGFLGRLGALVSGAFVGSAAPYQIVPPETYYRVKFLVLQQTTALNLPKGTFPIYARWGAAVHDVPTEENPNAGSIIVRG